MSARPASVRWPIRWDRKSQFVQTIYDHYSDEPEHDPAIIPPWSKEFAKNIPERTADLDVLDELFSREYDYDNFYGPVVYYIRCPANELVKIGSTTQWNDRWRDIWNGSPVELEILGYHEGDVKMEKAVHEQFASLRHHGEWFWPHVTLYKWIGRYCG